MKSVAIYYFSGTGNTEIVAEMLKEAFVRHECHADLIRIEDVMKNDMRIDIERYDLIGIGCQVIGYGVPKLVYDFIRLLPQGNWKATFVFRTAGGVAPMNFNASKPMLRKLHRKGYSPYYERVLSISSNWIVKFDDAVIRQLYKATKEKTGLMCNDLLRGERRIYQTGIGMKFKMTFIRAIASKLFRFMGKDYGVSKACTHCNLCVKTCPSANIRMKNGKVKFGLNCNCCMRCLYLCPKEAIHFRLFKFFRVPGGYNIKKILEQEQTDSSVPTATGSAPPFFNKYIQDHEL